MDSKANSTYVQVLNDLKGMIRQARQRAILAANLELLKLYWQVGKVILEQQKKTSWGAKVIDRLSADLKAEFPDMTGLSVRNLRYMRAFYEAYPQFMQLVVAQIEEPDTEHKTIVQPSVAQLEKLQLSIGRITWSHNLVLLDRVKSIEERLFYASKTLENGWSRDVLVHQIETGLHERQGNAITNFAQTLPQPQSDLARETFKSPYLFDFLGIDEKMKEREVEKALVQHLKAFLLELGRGFAYVGNQYNLRVEDDDYFLDLLFYNFHLHCFVVFELKIGDFKPEYAGKLNFYVNAIDEQIKGEQDQPTIGVLLCKTPNETVIKYALKGISSPLGIADYKLPKTLKREMPTVEELEAAIEMESRKPTQTTAGERRKK